MVETASPWRSGHPLREADALDAASGRTQILEKEVHMNIVEKAALIATVAHGATGQVRKHSGIDYINHPQDVVHILQGEAGSKITRRMLAAAWLHDVVEDTDICINYIKAEFDTAVARMVYGLTNERPDNLNRAARQAHNVVRLSLCADDVKTIKLADCIANMRDIIREDPKFAPVYLSEKRVLLDEALVGGDKTLWAIANDLITKNLMKELDAA
jgi:(p)ppGpp synthase/HD superfamily hydrolase